MKKGISLIALTATVVIILILVTTVTISGLQTADNARKIAFATELSLIQESTDTYASKNNGDYPVRDLIAVDMSQVTANAITQFSGEDMLNNKLNLYIIDYAKLNLTSLKYGSQANGQNDIYAVSEKTGRVYYVKGMKVGANTYFTLTDELKRLINYSTNTTQPNTTDGIIFTPSETKWTKNGVNVTVKVPKNYTSVTVSANGSNVSPEVSIYEDYDLYNVTGISGNYDVTVNYKINVTANLKNAKYSVENVDNVLPELVVDSINQKLMENSDNGSKYAYMNVTKKFDSLSGVKVVKYENEKIDQDKIATYFRTNGKTLSSDMLPIDKNVSYITVYIEDNAGNWTSEWITVDPQIYVKLLS